MIERGEENLRLIMFQQWGGVHPLILETEGMSVVGNPLNHEILQIEGDAVKRVQAPQPLGKRNGSK